ncbi:hypothetical protein JTE90_026104 [Oedothorax gibbosus]|uniref:Uncharacterized protein n=1 Tax=Oedothorax gibbosus TaxID=931172 RepID=A0AAV6TL04_9ARAC|nr:hypothetical protein JTE90_026104 [Oedothorax gibbosus]
MFTSVCDPGNIRVFKIKVEIRLDGKGRKVELEWNTPSSAAGAKYKKGCSLEDMSVCPQKIKCPPICKEGPKMHLLSMLSTADNCALAAVLQSQMLPSFVETCCKVLIADMINKVDSASAKEQLSSVISEIVAGA